MNTKMFRLVYSRCRRMLVAVAETASAAGKTHAGESVSGARIAARSATRVSLFAMRFAAFGALLAFGVVPSLVVAQVVGGGAHTPDVIQTQNGLPQVNINTPSGAGVSVNTYSQFDVQKPGVILNNSPTIVQTQLAELINGNANLAPGQSARIILNQVNSNSPSQLRGALEVAGNRAEVIVANGSGIVVDGGGFINTTRGILTTGAPVLDATGGLSGFNVTGGTIAVQGDGLNAKNVDQVDLIARAVEANAAIYANALNVVSGANQVGHDSLAATAISGNGSAPGVSIDVSQLGGMYANRIVLVGTENGVGVSNAGVIEAQAGELTLTTQGKLVLTGRTSASGDLTVSAAGGVENSGVTYGQQSVAVQTAGVLGNSGTLAAQRDLNVAAGSIASDGVLGAGINDDGSLAQSGDLTLSASGVLTATGTNAAGGDAMLQGAVVDLAGSTTAANGDLVLTATGGDLDASGAQVGAGGALTVTAAGTLDTSAATLGAAQLDIQAANLINRGGAITQTGTALTSISVTGTLDNTGGSLHTNSANLALGPAALLNDQGTITSSGDGTLSVNTGTLSNNGGTLATNGALDIHAGAVANQGGTLAGQSAATFLVASLDNSAGGYIGAQNVSIDSAGSLDNTDGTVQASGVLDVSAQTVSNDGGRIANGGSGATSVSADGVLTNTGNGLIGGNGDVSAVGGSINNAGGTITAGGAATVLSDSTLDNRSGLIQGNDAVTASAQGAIDNTSGQIEADGATAKLALTGASIDNTNGRVANIGTGATTINAATVTNANSGGAVGAGTIGGNGDVTVNAQTLSNTAGALVLSGRDLALNVAQSVDNGGGSLSAANHLTLSGLGGERTGGTGPTLSNQDGSIHASGELALNVAALDNTSGRIGNDAGSGGSVAITAGTLANQDGAIGSDQNLSLTTNQLDGDGSIIAGHDGAITINGDYTQSAANLIQANHDLTFSASGNLVNLGALAAVNALTLNAANLDNQAGATLNSTSTTVNAANAIANEGRIEGDNVTTNSATLTNTATVIGHNVTLNASSSIANTGPAAIIAAASELNLYSPGDISNTAGANLFSLGDIHIAANASRDANGLLANRSTSVTNDQSTIEAQGTIEIATQTLTNTRPAPTVETVTTDVDTVHQTKRARYMACATGNSVGDRCTQAMWNNGYRTPLDATFNASQIVSQSSGPNATDNVLIVDIDGQQQTLWYNTLTPNGDGSVTVNYWDDYDPNVNYLPSTEYATRSDGHNGYQRVEIARDTTTTTQQDQVTGPEAKQAQLLAGGNLVLANVGTLNNHHSAIAAGGSIQIGSSEQNGDIANGTGNYGGTTVNNIGQTLYQYQRQDIVSTYAWNENITQDVGTVVQPSVVLTPVAIGGTGGTIIANNAVQISATDISNTNVAAADSATGATGATLGANHLLAGTQVNAPQTVATSTGTLDITLPTSGLYTIHSTPDASYLIVTDPRLTSYTNFISSDYMLQQLGLNPQTIEKRLGDGMYEQQLVREQITQLTGRVYLDGYTDNLEQYQALMTSGANVAEQFGLVPGIALTAAQMDALTSDIVWLVSQTVTLPDGTTQQVLAPVVYLAQTHANDLQPTGALIAADDVQIHATGSAVNSGVIKGGTQTVISATDILNRGGAIGSSDADGTTILAASNDVVNASGMISGNRVAVLAGNDIVNTTLVDVNGISSAAGNSNVSQTLLGAQGTIASTGDMVIAAGNDLTVRGANISAGGAAQITAGNDITVDAVQSSTSQSLALNDQHHWEENTVINQTSAITAGGDLAIQSGNDATFRGATVTAGGDMAVVAGGDLTATTVTNTATRDNVAADSDTRKEISHTYDEQSVGTTFTAGGNATLAAISTDADKGNVTLTGSGLTAGMTDGVDNGAGTATIAATGNVTLNEAREQHDSYLETESKRGSAFAGSTTNTMESMQTNLGMGSIVSGDTVSITAGKDLTVQGSTVAGTHDVALAAAGNVTITTSQDTQSTSSYYRKHESGFGTAGGLGISFGTKTQTDTANTSQVVNTGSVVGSLNGNLDITAGNDLHVTGSDLIAAGNITGTGANVTIDAATNSAHADETHELKQSGFTLALKAPVIDAISNAVGQTQAASNSKDGRAAALHGIAAASAMWDADQAAGGLVRSLANGEMPQMKLELSFGSSSSKSTFSEDSTTSVGSSVTAGGTAAFLATGNTTPGSGNVTIVGSDVNAGEVILAAQNQVNLLNSTDTDSTRSTDESRSGSIGVSIGSGGIGLSAAMSKANGDGNSDATIQNNTHVNASGTATIISGGDTNIIGSNVSGQQVNASIGGDLNIASVQDTMTSAAHRESIGGGFSISQSGGSASFSQTNANASGSYAGVNEQAGIQAGDGGFNINVQGNTDLKGALISSEADASQNTLATGTLTFSDIQNSSNYEAHSGGFGAGVTAGDGGANYSTHGSTSGINGGGIAPMLSQNDSGSDSATTKTAVSEGTIVINDQSNQTQDVADLNRDTSDTNGTVAKLPDVNDLLDRQADMMAAASAAAEAVSRRIGDYAKMKYDEAAAAGDRAGMDAWKEGGTDRAMMQAAGAALVTGLAGGNALGGAAGAAIASIAAGQLNSLSEEIAGSDPTGNASMNLALGNIVANVLATGAGAVVGGEAGAFAGYNVDRFNRQLHPEEKAKAQQIAADAAAQGITNPDSSPITAAQIEDAMRAADNSQYEEYTSTGIVVPLNADTPTNAVYDTTSMNLVTDSTGHYLMQDASILATPSKAVQDLITQSTGDASSPYSWGTSSAQAATPKVDPYGPFSPGFNTGDYSAGFGEYGRGLAPDYATIGSGSLSASADLSVNLHDGTTYAAGGITQSNPGSISVKPGGVASLGWIFGDRTGAGTNSFMNGDGVQGFISVPTPFNVNAFLAITHAYGGNTALEVGVATPGSTSFGVSPFSHSIPISGSKEN
ncbi:filamentous hemagglutinin [Burkholderia sp. SRS-W-2-2016]|uniref:hemagglutinin repeat-containing protein n=1 Tax=Burkholderia sp. SRS-W-2-2016 TaxID=1926878 RepID=UPI00094AACB9|nr:hemagglutinin repeat-containing protein [Burkholderia sp. SRS-W-2-2016]OLL31544.1 filamentous hemagglutinin [Burkholderia sp. SRS-W-2-2016]